MSLATVLKVLLRPSKGRLNRIVSWLLGRKNYSWTESPLHKLLKLLARTSYLRPSVRYRVQYSVAAGLLKFRERACADRMNFGARLHGPVTSEVLKNVVLWQFAVLKIPPYAPKPHANLYVSGDVEQLRLNRLMALLLVSDVFENVNVFFDDQSAYDARFIALTVAEEQRAEDGFDLNSRRHSLAIGFDDPSWARIFSVRTDIGVFRKVNNYFKTAYPGSFVVAIDLPEDEDGFCDESIGEWVNATRDFLGTYPGVTFVVLNCIGPGLLKGKLLSPIAFASRAGLNLPESICLAQKADAYLGHMGVFGFAARAARRPGVYMNDMDQYPNDTEIGITHTGVLEPPLALALLASTLEANSGCWFPSPQPVHRAACPKLQAADAGSGPCIPPPLAPAALASAVHARGDRFANMRSGERVRSQDKPDRAYTLVVPTYNRHAELTRLLGYLAREGTQFPIVVLDSGAARVQEQNARTIAERFPNVRHVTYPDTIDPYSKMRDGFNAVTTPYCSMCADDDVVLPAALEPCIKALDGDAGVAAAHGYYFNFADQAMFDLTFIVYRGDSLVDDDPLARIRALFTAYEAPLYGVYRTSVMQRVFRDVDRMNTVLGRELLVGALTALFGKVLRVPGFYYGRSTGESGSYASWHPHQIIASAPDQLFKEYVLFRQILLEALAEKNGDQRESDGVMIDLLMLRYLGPFLRNDLLDLVMSRKMSGHPPQLIVEDIWNLFVRSRRSNHSIQPLLDPGNQAFAPDKIQPKAKFDYFDYSFDSRTIDGKTRTYRIFFEFLFPELRPPAVVTQDQLFSMLRALDAY